MAHSTQATGLSATAISSRSGFSTIEDQSSLYYLHHSDSTSAALVSQHLVGENYASWSRAMKLALIVKNKIGFVDGSIQRPDGTDDHLLNSWLRNNNIIISWIVNFVSKDIAASIIYSPFALDIWNDLRDRFHQSNGPRIFQLKRDLLSFSQNQQPVSVYFTKLKTLWEELVEYRPNCTCGSCTCDGIKELAVFHHMEYVMTFLMGLNDSFSHIRGQILMMDPLPPISKVFLLLIQEESQQRLNSNSSQFAPSQVPASGSPAFAIGSSQSKRSTPRKDLPWYTHCKIHGHTVETCYQIHGYPPGVRPRTSSVHMPRTPPVPSRGNYRAQSSVAPTNLVVESPAVAPGNFFQSLSSYQYHQLISMLTSHVASSSTPSTTTTPQVDSGPSTSEDDWQG